MPRLFVYATNNCNKSLQFSRWLENSLANELSNQPCTLLLVSLQLSPAHNSQLTTHFNSHLTAKTTSQHYHFSILISLCSIDLELSAEPRRDWSSCCFERPESSKLIPQIAAYQFETTTKEKKNFFRLDVSREILECSLKQ